MRVITYQSPSGAKINICESCAERLRDAWPRDETGREFCAVSRGLHKGECDVHEPGRVLYAVAVAVVRRLPAIAGDNEAVYTVRGEVVSADDVADVEVVAGRITTAWSDVPLPPCPDCGGALRWAEAGRVPGARECVGCGSLFTVETAYRIYGGRLATEHAASSYGLPVLVTSEGEALGPADIEHIVIPPHPTDEERAILRGAIEAGYLVRGA
jgi:hypothetical protein